MDFSKLTIGVLAVQGDFERHQHQVELLGARCRQVRLAGDLQGLDALVMPGGESTTMNILFDRFDIRRPLQEFAAVKPVYGTCAGMIMLARAVVDNLSHVEPLGLMDIDVIRNGYGRQVFSFEADLQADLSETRHTLAATFIRAPKVVRTGAGVTVLASLDDSPVLVREKNILASSFHTELDDDTRLLEYFLSDFLLSPAAKRRILRR